MSYCNNQTRLLKLLQKQAVSIFQTSYKFLRQAHCKEKNFVYSTIFDDKLKSLSLIIVKVRKMPFVFSDFNFLFISNLASNVSEIGVWNIAQEERSKKERKNKLRIHKASFANNQKSAVLDYPRYFSCI